jgi:hypothetical protein
LLRPIGLRLNTPGVHPKLANMSTLQQLIPDVEVLLALSPEELAPYLLEVAKSQLQNGTVDVNGLTLSSGAGTEANRHSPWALREKEINLAVYEAWNCLRVQGMLVPAAGSSGAYGFCRVSRRGEKIKNKDDFKRLTEANVLRKQPLFQNHGYIHQ